MGDDVTAVVIDNGSGLTKAGLAGDESPRAIVPTLTGTPKYTHLDETSEYKKDAYVGDEAQKKRGILNLINPIKNGIVEDWDAMQHIWDYIFETELNVVPEDHPVVLTDPVLNPQSNREKMTQVMFEELQVAALFVALQPVLAIYASGRTDGIVLDIGEGLTQTVPINGGYAIPNASFRQHMAGWELTEYMKKLLAETGHSWEAGDDRAIIRELKENVCCVSKDLSKQLEVSAVCGKENVKVYELPDGMKVTVGDIRFKCAEALFNPLALGLEELGIHDTLHCSIMKCDMDSHKDLYSNIVLAGGTSMCEGFPQRLETEIRSLAPPSCRVNIMDSPERKNYVWIGGSILSSLSTFQQMWVSKSEYDEVGPNIVHKKCF